MAVLYNAQALYRPVLNAHQVRQLDFSIYAEFAGVFMVYVRMKFRMIH
jgi:hypothetical protein